MDWRGVDNTDEDINDVITTSCEKLPMPLLFILDLIKYVIDHLIFTLLWPHTTSDPSFKQNAEAEICNPPEGKRC